MKKKILFIAFIFFLVFQQSCSRKKEEEIKKPEVEKARIEVVKDYLPQKIKKPEIPKPKIKKLKKEDKKGGVLFARTFNNCQVILPLKKTKTGHGYEKISYSFLVQHVF